MRTAMGFFDRRPQYEHFLSLALSRTKFRMA